MEKIKQRVLVREFLSQFSTKLHQNLINSSLGNGKCVCKIWRQNVYYFLSYRVHRQTHIHTHICTHMHTYKPRWLHNLLAEVTRKYFFKKEIMLRSNIIIELLDVYNCIIIIDHVNILRNEIGPFCEAGGIWVFFIFLLILINYKIPD